jgi:CRP-like cAMP-binding protein
MKEQLVETRGMTPGDAVLEIPLSPGTVAIDRPTIDVHGALAGRDVYFSQRTLIYLEGALVDLIYQVIDGAVMLYKLLPDGRRQVVEVLGAGDIFGFSPSPVHDCFAETLMGTRCTVFDRAQLERSPASMRRLCSHLYVQVRNLHEHTVLLGRKTAIERIASFLMRCVPGRGGQNCPGPRRGNDSAQVHLAMTRLEIADYLGLTIETVSRSLTKLKRRGVLSLSRLDEICVHDVCQLCRLTGTPLTRGQWCSSRVEALIKDPWT